MERSRGRVRRRLARYLETLAHESNAAIVVQEENSVKLQAEPRYIPDLDKREIQGAPQEMPPGPSVTFRGMCYAACFAAFTLAHRARWAAAIFLRAAADICLGFAAVAGCAIALCFAHRAFCARLIFLRAAADKARLGFV